MSRFQEQRVHPKVRATGAVGGTAVLIVYLASLAGVELPAEVAVAITSVLSTIAAYLKS